MERREFLRIIPIAAVAPEVVRDGVVRLKLPEGGHFVIVCDRNKVDSHALSQYPRELLPPGATGGWILEVDGDPNEALKFYQLNKDA